MKLNSLDKSHEKFVQKSPGDSVDGTSSRISTKCSVQEGVRMMVTPSMFMTGQSAADKAAMNTSTTHQRVTVVGQSKSQPPTATAMAAMTTTQNGSSGDALTSSQRATLGRQKRIVEATTVDKIIQPTLKTIEKITEFGSPDSPLSKMHIMPNPLPHATPRTFDAILTSATSSSTTTTSAVAIGTVKRPQLEFPTPERLLPIGQHNKETALTFAEKMQEVLSTTDISHLKQESSFERSEEVNSLVFTEIMTVFIDFDY